MSTTKSTKKSKTFNKAQYLRKLIRELRSGKYVQIEDNLKGEEGEYCLWGLGCELYRQDYNSCEWDGSELVYVPDDWQKRLWENPDQCLEDIMERESGDIPEFIQKKLKSDGSIRVGNATYCTMAMNDKGVTFEGLAALLEKYPLVNGKHDISLAHEDDLEATFTKLFKGTKLEKNWRERAIRGGSSYDDILQDQAEDAAYDSQDLEDE